MGESFHDRVGTAPRSTRGVRGAVAPKGQPMAESANEEHRHPATVALAPMSPTRRWAANFDTFWGAAQTYDDLPPGAYRCGFVNGTGPVLNRVRVETDHLLIFPDEASARIIAEFDRFWIRKREFETRGFLHKRGFMLWGPPGSGKTSTMALMNKSLTEDRKGIVIFIDHPDLAAQCLQMVRAIEQKRPVIAVMEDLDALVERHGENEFLALLDGEAQVDSICYVATTNYPERLDWRFVDRPSRFDTVAEIGMPTAAARRMYLQAREPSMSEDERNQWVKLSSGFSVAHLKEMIIAVKCLGQSLEDTVARLREMQDRKAKSDGSNGRRRVGFRFRHGGDDALAALNS
jgi:hypothetical protein